MAIVDRRSRARSIYVSSAAPNECMLVEETLKRKFTRRKIKRLTGDKAYDSERLDKLLRRKGVEINAPHRHKRKAPRTQDGRKLRSYKHRWTIERFFAWLFNYKRTVIRYEVKVENFEAFIHIACISINW